MTAMPLSDCDSMCSMSLTVVVMLRSLLAGDAVGHLLGGEAGVLPDDADDGDIDVRKDVRRHLRMLKAPISKQKNCKDGKGVRPP
jgi:hypothetical protein